MKIKFYLLIATILLCSFSMSACKEQTEPTNNEQQAQSESIKTPPPAVKPVTEQASTTKAHTPAIPTTGVTTENFNRLKTGMSYKEVVKIIGKEGEELSSS